MNISKLKSWKFCLRSAWNLNINVISLFYLYWPKADEAILSWCYVCHACICLSVNFSFNHLFWFSTRMFLKWTFIRFLEEILIHYKKKVLWLGFVFPTGIWHKNEIFGNLPLWNHSLDFYLTHCHWILTLNTSEKESFRKQCRKRRKCW